MAFRIIRRLSELLDVDTSGANDQDRLVFDADTSMWVPAAGAVGGGGAPTDANYLVGTANGDLDAEIVVGTSPGGELGGTWASPTVDATHSGSSHASVQAAAEATAAGALSAHASDTTGVHGIADTSSLVLTGDSRLTDSRTPTGSAGGVLGGTYPNPSFASDMATQAELDAAISGLAASYQPLDSDLTAIAALSTTTYGRAVLALADAAALRTAAGLVIGTNVQAFDAELAALAGLTSAADKLPYFTGSGTADVTTLSSFMRGLLDDTDAATARTTLGVSASALVKIYDSTLGSDTASFDITSIPGTYAHLRLVVYLRSTRAATSDVAKVNFNNDSGANYTDQVVYGASSAAGANKDQEGTSTARIATVSAASATAGYFSGSEITIPNYAGTAGHKMFHGTCYERTIPVSAVHSGFWASTSAITRITIVPGSGNWLTGSRVTLYGMA